MARHHWIAPIERKAEALLVGHRETPVAVNAVAAALGLVVEAASLGDDVSGILVVNGDRGVIGFNREHPIFRQRFTVAHEIGHFVLHRREEQLFIDKMYRAFFRDGTSRQGTDLRERDANAFAAALLMPGSFVRRAARRHHFELGDEGGPVQDLAQLFQVSTQAMTYRLVNLGIIAPIAAASSA
jgi:Zn-dependent peptidase ImmA (M78 family)